MTLRMLSILYEVLPESSKVDAAAELRSLTLKGLLPPEANGK
jgi:hypothetical protein